MSTKLQILSKRGLVPGPKEGEAEFFARCTDSIHNDEPALGELERLFRVRPDWIRVTYSNKGLLPWEGGCVDLKEGFHLHVRKKLKKSGRYLALYSRDEIVAHEFVHGVRMHFEEDRFEEILAYQTSRSRFRRYFGPLFRSSKESLGLVLFSFASMFSPLFLLGVGLILGWGLVRLVKNQRILSRCLRKLEELGLPPLPVALRLTDDEIVSFSTWSKEKILAYAQDQKCLRWQQLTPFMGDGERVFERVL